MKPSVETRLRVRYAETDQMGVVYYSNYLIWMEVGRVELCRACGFTYREMEREDGVYMAVAEANCRYRFPARYDEEIVVKSWIEEANSRVVLIHYEINLAESGRRLATGYTRHVFVDRNMQRSRLPRKYFAMFGIPEAGTVPAPSPARRGL